MKLFFYFILKFVILNCYYLLFVKTIKFKILSINEITNITEIIINEFLFLSIFNSLYNTSYLFFTSAYNFSNSNYLPNQINFANQLYENGKKLRAYTHLIRIEPKTNSLGSKSQLGYLYVILSSITLRVDEELCRIYLKKMEAMLDECDKNKTTKGMLLLNLANRYILLNEYEQVKRFTEEYRLLYRNRHVEHNVIKLCYCAHMLNQPFGSDWFLDEYVVKEDQLDLALYEYFKGIERGVEKNMKFLMKKVKPYLTEYDQTYVKIIRDELYLLSNS